MNSFHGLFQDLEDRLQSLSFDPVHSAILRNTGHCACCVAVWWHQIFINKLSKFRDTQGLLMSAVLQLPWGFILSDSDFLAAYELDFLFEFNIDVFFELAIEYNIQKRVFFTLLDNDLFVDVIDCFDFIQNIRNLLVVPAVKLR